MPIDPLVVKIISDIDTPYTSCYCEENIYLASQRLTTSAHEALEAVYVVFISNLTKTVLLWEQRASQYPAGLGSPVVWDYHVIMILVASSPQENVSIFDRIYVIDFDSSLGKLTSWKGEDVSWLGIPCGPPQHISHRIYFQNVQTGALRE